MYTINCTLCSYMEFIIKMRLLEVIINGKTGRLINKIWSSSQNFDALFCTSRKIRS